jgi:hypothetical protein
MELVPLELARDDYPSGGRHMQLTVGPDRSGYQPELGVPLGDQQWIKPDRGVAVQAGII